MRPPRPYSRSGAANSSLRSRFRRPPLRTRRWRMRPRATAARWPSGRRPSCPAATGAECQSTARSTCGMCHPRRRASSALPTHLISHPLVQDYLHRSQRRQHGVCVAPRRRGECPCDRVCGQLSPLPVRGRRERWLPHGSSPKVVNVRAVGRRRQQGPVIIFERYRIGKHQSNPSSFPPPCIGNWLVRLPSRIVRCPLPPLWVWKVQPCLLSQRRNSLAVIRSYRAQHLCCCQRPCCLCRRRYGLANRRTSR